VLLVATAQVYGHFLLTKRDAVFGVWTGVKLASAEGGQGRVPSPPITTCWSRGEPKLDILVNNAGTAWLAEFDAFPEKGWDKVMDLNVKSPFFLTQALAESLRNAASKEKPAKAINVASIDGIRPNPQETYSYQASKAALIHLTRRTPFTLSGLVKQRSSRCAAALCPQSKRTIC